MEIYRMKGKPTYSKQVIEIADYIFANPTKNTTEILSYFVVFCRKNRRTVERYVKQAREYNKERQNKVEKAKDEVLLAETKKAVKSSILSRNESLEILSNIAKRSKIEKNKVSAIQQLSKMEGWDAVTKTELTGKDGSPLNPEPLTIEIIDSREKVISNADTND